MKRIAYKFALTIGCASMFVTSFVCTSALATTFGGKWNKPTVYLKIVDTMPSAYTTAFQVAYPKWNGIDANINLGKVVYATPDVTIENWYDYYAEKQRWYGKGEPNDENGDDIGTYQSGRVWIVRKNCDPLDVTGKTQVFVHEFGHILGLAHTVDSWWSDEIDSVMDEDDAFDLDGPSDYDKGEIRRLY